MLRKLEVPDCADALFNVIDFQRQLLEFVADHKEVDWNKIKNKFGGDTTHWLNQQRTVLIDNLTNNTKPNRKNYIEFPKDKKLEIYNAFCNDIKFHTKPNAEGFTFQLDGSCKEIKEWLIWFYEIFTRRGGFPPSITGQTEMLTGDYWWKSFRKTNNQYTCPICDKLLDETQSIEHFFPKAIYPALVIHPNNLFPSCERCNNNKGDIDPLDSRSLPSSLHPYYHPLEKDSLVHYKFSNGNEIIYLHPNCHTSQEFTRLFKLPDRWNEKMYRSIEHRAFSTLSNILKYDPNAKHETQEQIICRGIEAITSDWGQDSYAYVATQWISEIAPKKWDSLLSEVYS